MGPYIGKLSNRFIQPTIDGYAVIRIFRYIGILKEHNKICTLKTAIVEPIVGPIPVAAIICVNTVNKLHLDHTGQDTRWTRRVPIKWSKPHGS